jgi:DNA-binding transcriptional regulator LsrR (DeoR family)
MPQKNPQFEDKLKLLKRVAVLRSQGWDQASIAESLGVSQSAVSKLLDKALHGDPPLLRESLPICVFDDADMIARDLMDTRELEDRLRELAKLEGWVRVPNVRTYSAGPYGEPTEQQEEQGQGLREWDEAVVRWGKAVSKPVFDLLSGSETIGICWGRQIRSVVDGMHALGQKARSPVRVAPMWGQRLTLEPEKYDTVFTNHLKLGCNSLAADLATALNGNTINPYEYFMPVFDLIPICSIISFDNLTEYQLKAYRKKLKKELDDYKDSVMDLRNKLNTIDTYNNVFGYDRTAFARRMQTVIAAVGASGRGAFGRGEKYGNIPRQWLKDCILGDIGGVLLPKPSDELPMGRNEAVVRWQFRLFRYHWTGVRRLDLKACARRADRDGHPGVIVLAVGWRRAPVTLACMRQGLVNHLFADNVHAQQLQRLVESELQAVRGRPSAPGHYRRR